MGDSTWFGVDGWHYLTSRGTAEGYGTSWLTPWGGHWQTVPVALYRAMFEVAGMRSHLPYVLMATTVHLVVCGLLHTLLRRSGTRRASALLVTWTVLFFGAGAEAFAYDAPIPLTLALALGLGALLLRLPDGEPSRRRWWAVVALLVLAVMTSGVGLVSSFLVALHAWMRDGWAGLRSGLRQVAPPAVLFVGWFVTVGRTGNRVSTEPGELLSVPAFVAAGLTGATGSLALLPGAGAVLLVVLALTPLVARGVTPGARLLALVGLAGAVVQMSLSALGGVRFGLEVADASRYQYLAAVLLAPALALMLDAVRAAVAPRLRGAGVRVAVPLALVAVVVAGTTVEGMRQERAEVAESRALGEVALTWALGTVAASDAGGRVLTPSPADELVGPAVDVRAILDPTLRAALPHRAATPQQRIDAEAEFFVAVDDEQHGLFGAAEPQLRDFSGTLPTAGCGEVQATSLSPALDLPVGQGVEIGVTSEATAVTTTLTRDGVTSKERVWSVEAGPVYVASTAQDAVLTVRFNEAGSYLMCVGA